MNFFPDSALSEQGPLLWQQHLQKSESISSSQRIICIEQSLLFLDSFWHGARHLSESSEKLPAQFTLWTTLLPLFRGDLPQRCSLYCSKKRSLSVKKWLQLALRNFFSFWRQPWTGHLESCLVIQTHVPVLLAHVSWQMHQNSLQYFRHSTVSSMHWTWKRGSRAGSQGINVFMTLDQGSFKPGHACL